MAVVLSERADTGREEPIRPQPRGEPSALRPAPAASLDRSGKSRCLRCSASIGALMSVLIVPAYWLFVRDPAHRARAVRSVVYQLMRNYVGSMRALRLIDLEISGLDARAGAGLADRRQSSVADRRAHLAGPCERRRRGRQALVAGKPFTAGGIRGADYVVNADALSLIEECRARIAAGESLVLFPECTRTADDGVIRLQRGAAHIAVRSGCPVIPVTIEFSEPLLTKKSRWWLAPKVRPRVRVVGHPAIDPAQFLHGARSVSLAARAVDRTFA